MTSPNATRPRRGRPVWAIVGQGFLLLTFVVLAFTASTIPLFLPIDLPLAVFVQAATPAPLDWLFEAVSALGQRVPWAMFTLGVAALLWRQRYRLEGAFVVASFVPGIVNWLLKLAVDRPRPDASFVRILEPGAATSGSFPSGHVVQFTVLFGLLFLFAGTYLEGAGRTWAQRACVLLIALVGPARVYMGVHWPSDVLGGYLLGGLCLSLLAWLYAEMRPARPNPRPSPLSGGESPWRRRAASGDFP